MTIVGLDLSKWQGTITAATVAAMKAQGVQFCGVRVSSGAGYQDPQAFNSARLLQAGGIMVYPYHFTTNDNAADQYNWFVYCMGNIEWDLPPALDCEAFTATGYGEVVSHDLVFNLSYPSEAIVDSIGRSLTALMATRPKWKPYVYPTIYTNYSSGNIIFKTASMSRYSLWVANWNVEKPLKPNVWKGTKYMIWQDAVVDGTPYGIAGKVDHDVWGDLFPFPGAPIPPPPEQDYIDLVGTSKDGSKWAGRLTEQ